MPSGMVIIEDKLAKKMSIIIKETVPAENEVSLDPNK